jgi:hypothetical protein
MIWIIVIIGVGVGGGGGVGIGGDGSCQSAIIIIIIITAINTAIILVFVFFHCLYIKVFLTIEHTNVYPLDHIPLCVLLLGSEWRWMHYICEHISSINITVIYIEWWGHSD